MFESHVVTSMSGRASSFDLKIFEQSAAFVNNNLLCHWPSIHNSILRSVLNCKLSVFTFLRSMSCSMSIEQKMCKVKIFQLQSISNAMIYIDKRFVVKNSGISCLALIFNLSNPRTTVLHVKIRFKVAICDESYTVFFARSIPTHCWVVQADSSEQGDLRSPLAGALKTLCRPSAILRGSGAGFHISYFVSGNLALTGFTS